MLIVFSLLIAAWLALSNGVLGFPPSPGSQVAGALENAVQIASEQLGSHVPHLVVPHSAPQIPVTAVKLPYLARFEKSLSSVLNRYTRVMAKYNLPSSRGRFELLEMIALAELSGVKNIAQRMSIYSGTIQCN
jgi:hypothetical protein